MQEERTITGLTIRNGAIRGFDTGYRNSDLIFDGTDIFIINLRGALLRDLSVNGARIGIQLGSRSVAESCRVSVAQTGITASQSTVRNCSVEITGEGFGTGFQGNTSTFRDCIASMTAETDESSNAYNLLFSVANGCVAQGTGTGFVLTFRSVANTCSSTSVAAFASIDAGSSAVDCNF